MSGHKPWSEIKFKSEERDNMTDEETTGILHKFWTTLREQLMLMHARVGGWLNDEPKDDDNGDDFHTIP